MIITKLTVQRGFTNPAPKTESAREAVKSFYCMILLHSNNSNSHDQANYVAKAMLE
jgi:hypothetical protein